MKDIGFIGNYLKPIIDGLYVIRKYGQNNSVEQNHGHTKFDSGRSV
jgi:hypothetical protein